MTTKPSEQMSEFIRIIGLLVVTASSFDYKLANLLTDCFCLTATQSNVMLRPLGTRAKIEIILRLAKFVDSPQLGAIKKWCQTAKDRFEDRNTVIHGVPGIDDGKITLRLYSAGRAFGGEPEEWPPARVRQITFGILELEKEIQTLLKPAFATWIQATESHLRTDFLPALSARL